MNLNILKISFLILIVSLLTLFSFNKNQNRSIKFSDLSYLATDFKFISKDSVNKLLTQSKLISNEILKSNLNLKEIERVILSNEYVSSVEVSISIEGKVGVNIIEKNPVFRVLNEKYYVDADGKKMPLSKNFSETCPMILSIVDSIDLKMLGDLGIYIKNHKFLLTSILFFTIIELIITYIVFGVEVRDKSSNLFLIVFSGLIAGYLGFFIRSKFRKK